MIWKEPVYKDRPVRKWLDNDSGFPIGIRDLVEEQKVGKAIPSQRLTNGLLVIVGREDEEGPEKIAQLLSLLKNHADLAIYLNGYRVLTLQRDRNVHPATGRPIAETIEEADVLVVSGLKKLTEKQTDLIDQMLVARAHREQKITVAWVPDPEEFPFDLTFDEYADRAEEY